MAYGEFGGFLPREGNYSSPAAYTEAAKAEAYKKSSYLAQMDQFQQELAESTRRFDITQAWAEKSFGETLEWNKEYGREQIRQGDERLAWDTSYGTQDLALRGELGRGQLELGRDTLEYNKENAATLAELEGRKLDIESQSVSNQYSLGLGSQGIQKQGLSIQQQGVDEQGKQNAWERSQGEQAFDLASPYMVENASLKNQAWQQRNSASSVRGTDMGLEEYLNRPYTGGSSSSYSGNQIQQYSYGGQSYSYGGASNVPYYSVDDLTWEE
jgi:hypothetical protein